MKYIKKSIVIEAIQVLITPKRISKIQKVLGIDSLKVNYEDCDNPFISIETPKGIMKAFEGDFIVKGACGEVYACNIENLPTDLQLCYF